MCEKCDIDHPEEQFPSARAWERYEDGTAHSDVGPLPLVGIAFSLGDHSTIPPPKPYDPTICIYWKCEKKRTTKLYCDEHLLTVEENIRKGKEQDLKIGAAADKTGGSPAIQPADPISTQEGS